MATRDSSAQNRNGFKYFLKRNIVSLSLYTLLWTIIWTIVICASAFLIYMLSLDAEIHLNTKVMKLNYSSIVYYVDENGVETEKFEKIYCMLIDEIKAACPDTKLIIIAPPSWLYNHIIFCFRKSYKRQEM